MGLKSSKSKGPAPEKKLSPAEQFSDGSIVILTSKVTKKSLRIHEDLADALGENSEEVQFTVHKKESESGLVVTLQSVANAEKYVQIRESAVEGCGSGDELSELKVTECDEEYVALESVKCPGQFIIVGEDGCLQLASEIGPSVHFTVSSPAAKESEEATLKAESDAKDAEEATPQTESDPKDTEEEATPQSEPDPTPASTQQEQEQQQSESEPPSEPQQQAEQQEQDPEPAELTTEETQEETEAASS